MVKILHASAFQEAEAYLYNIPKFTKKNDLKNTEKLLEKLGNPSLDKKIIHIAGTNGKGSVCAFLKSLLLEKGEQVGVFTSPHLESMQERFCLNQTNVSEQGFLEAFDKVKNVVSEVMQEKKGIEHPTFFEFLFLMAMVIFEEAKVEYIILETGLGGRLDSTNVIKKPVLTILTKIGLDHCQYLGNSKAEIAFEKAGILKKEVPVVYWDTNSEVTDIIHEKAKELHVKEYLVSCLNCELQKNSYKTIDFYYKSRYYDYVSFTLHGVALYQMENSAIALTAYEILFPKEECNLVQMKKAILETRWAGRMEEILPNVYLDGAHNEDGIDAFLQSVNALPEKIVKTLLFSAVADKEYRKMIKKIEESDTFDFICVVEMPDERAASKNELKECFTGRMDGKLVFAESIQEGLSFCLANQKVEDYVFIAGSLYLAGFIKGALRRI